MNTRPSILISICFLLLASFGCEEKTPDALTLAHSVNASYEQHSSLSYDIAYQIKYFSSETDTIKIDAHIDLIPDKEDSVFGGHVWISGDSIDRYYDTEHLYFIEHNKKKITRFTPDKPWIITGNTVGEAIRIYFLNPKRFINGASDSTISTVITPSSIDGKPMWKWTYNFPDDEETSDQWKEIWIDKKSHAVSKMVYSTNMLGENQYNQWDMSSLAFSKVTPSGLKARFEKIEAGYTLEDFKERPKEETEPLAIGTPVPALTGTLYPNEEAVSLEDYKGKLVLVDFWYMDCYPCIKAIPHLGELYNKYKDQGFEVLGVNPYNNNEKDLKRFPKFLSKTPIEYPFIFTEREAPMPFKVHAYPTFYLIGRDGKVVHTQVGFAEQLAAQIDSLVRVNL